MGATQVPSGSALAVQKGPQRRKAGVGLPKKLGFAEGGLVQTVSRGIEKVARAAGTESGKAIEKAEKVIRQETPSESVATAIQHASQRPQAAAERAERGYAAGGTVRARKPVGPRRLAYAEGGMVDRDRLRVSGKDMTIRSDPYKRLPPEKQEKLDRDLDASGKERIKT